MSLEETRHARSPSPETSPFKRHSRALRYERCALFERVREGYAPAVAHYIFNFVSAAASERSAQREWAARFLSVRMWAIDQAERHRGALAPGDLVLVYLGAPAREFIGRAELASASHDWTPSEAQSYPGDSPGGVLLAEVEEWNPPVPMHTVLSEVDSPEATADFDASVVRITVHEYETALAVAAARAPSTG